MAGSCGKTCALVTAILLLACGATTIIIAATSMNVPEDSISVACEKLSGSVDCIAITIQAEIKKETKDIEDGPQKAAKEAEIEANIMANIPKKEDLYNGCMHQIRQENLECVCDDDVTKWKDCDCSEGNAAAMVIGIWPSIMIGIGMFGLVFCVIVAILAFMATRKSSAVCCYSACSGLLALIFLAVGAVFTMIGLSAASPSNLATQADPTLTWVGDEAQCPDGFAVLMGSDSDDENQALKCLLEALCAALTVILQKLTVLGLGIGIPNFVAGAAMFIACYACCCCKSAFEEQGAPATAGAPGNEDDFPGAEFYPPPNEAASPVDPMASKASGQPLSQPGIYPSAY